jgi:hypothetical protein
VLVSVLPPNDATMPQVDNIGTQVPKASSRSLNPSLSTSLIRPEHHPIDVSVGANFCTNFGRSGRAEAPLSSDLTACGSGSGIVDLAVSPLPHRASAPRARYRNVVCDRLQSHGRSLDRLAANIDAQNVRHRNEC